MFQITLLRLAFFYTHLYVMCAAGLHVPDAGWASRSDGVGDTFLLPCAGNTLGLPSTLYLGEGMAGRDVREEKLLELGFVVAREGGNLMLINISNITSDAENDSGILTLPNAGGCDNSRVAAIRIDEISVVECDDLQTALAVAAYHQWNSLKSICDSRDRWRSYVARLKKELDRAKLEWNEVQALFTVDQQRFSEPNVT